MYRYFDSSATLAIASLVFASKLNNYFSTLHFSLFIIRARLLFKYYS